MPHSVHPGSSRSVTPTDIPERPWWKDGVVYQIYPASFKDSNGDGIGDIRGIISELDHIQDLGIDIVWVCPMYDSPQYDMGYDISDYEAVYPPYGTIADMEELIQACHGRGMRIILDLVINHTSHLHKWFQESRSSKTNPKRDWYIWRPAKYDAAGNRMPPNNWRATFGGSVWEWDEHTQEYYLHLFTPEQPDLNWENEETRNAIYESAMEFWLRKGVDGFRIDTVNMYSKDPTFVDAPVIDANSAYQEAADYYCNGPRMHEFLSEMNAKVLSKYDAMTVGETPNTPDLQRVLKYVSAREKQMNMVFMFDAVALGVGKDYKYDTVPRAWTLPDLKNAIGRMQSLLQCTDAWTTVFLENHDQSRSVSRYASDKPEHRVAAAKLLALMLAALSGTLYIFQGQEIGMVNLPPEVPVEEYKDVDSANYYAMVREQTGADPEKLAAAKAALQYLARDHGRTPMQWDASPHAGFTAPDAEPWMVVNGSYGEINVAQQRRDEGSALSFWKRMLRLRREYGDVFVHGSYGVCDEANEDTYVFVKEWRGQRALVVLNFTERSREVPGVEGLLGPKARMLVSSHDSAGGMLAPFEGRIYFVA